MGGDEDWSFRAVRFIATLVGIFLISILIGTISSSIVKLDELKKGRSRVLESNHTLILGWSEKVFAIILEIITQANCATDKIGVKFLTGAYTCNSLITNSSSIHTNSVITDSLNWTRISGSFIADSAYTYLAIGNFFDDANTDTIKFYSDFSDNAYYFLDDVCVSTDSLYTNNYNYTSIIENSLPKLINFYPNPVSEDLTIQNLSYQELDIDIYNVLGELSYTLHNVSEKTLNIYLGNLKAGLLFIKTKSGPQTKNI